MIFLPKKVIDEKDKKLAPSPCRLIEKIQQPRFHGNLLKGKFCHKGETFTVIVPKKKLNNTVSMQAPYLAWRFEVTADFSRAVAIQIG